MIKRRLRRFKHLFVLPPERPAWSRRQEEFALWLANRGDATLRLDYDLDENSIIFDVGGYRGQWTSDVFSRYCPTIYLFEPAAEHLKELRRIFSRNKKIIICPYGLAGASGTAQIFLHGDQTSTIKNQVNSEEVKLVGVLDFIKENKLEKIDLLKLNLEGGEYEILESLLASGWIKNVKNIQVQFHDFVEPTGESMRSIQDKLRQTHALTYHYEFIWENWRRHGEAAAAKQPQIDVIIPAYNAEKFIAAALASVVRQTVVPHQLIVVNDGSTDRTEETVLSFQQSSPVPLEYIYQENKGPNAARNRGLQASRAEFVAFLDADDEWYENKLAQQLAVFNRSPFKNLGLVYCQHDILKEDGTVIDCRQQLIPEDNRGLMFEKLLAGNKINGSASAVLVKRACFDKVGYFDEGLLACEDWDMWLRLARFYEIDFSPLCLLRLRRHARAAQNDRRHYYENQLSFYDKWGQRLGRSQVPTIWRLHIARLFLLARSFAFVRAFGAKLSEESRMEIFGRQPVAFYLLSYSLKKAVKKFVIFMVKLFLGKNFYSKFKDKYAR